MAEAKKTAPKKTQKLEKKVSVKKNSPKKIVSKKTSSTKKTSPKAVKSVEQEIEQAAVTAVNTTKKVAKTAVSKAKQVIEDVHFDEKMKQVEKVGKKALVSARKKIEEAHIEETSKEYFSIVSKTIKKLGAKIRYKAHGIEEVPATAGKTISSALIAGKESAKKSMIAMGITKQEPPKQKIFGVEITDEMFRAFVLIFLLVLFFYIGMIFGEMKAFHHIERKLHNMRGYENSMKYDRDNTITEKNDIPVQEIFSERVIPGDNPTVILEEPVFVPEPPQIFPVAEEVPE